MVSRHRIWMRGVALLSFGGLVAGCENASEFLAGLHNTCETSFEAYIWVGSGESGWVALAPGDAVYLGIQYGHGDRQLRVRNSTEIVFSIPVDDFRRVLDRDWDREIGLTVEQCSTLG